MGLAIGVTTGPPWAWTATAAARVAMMVVNCILEEKCVLIFFGDRREI